MSELIFELRVCDGEQKFGSILDLPVLQGGDAWTTSPKEAFQMTGKGSNCFLVMYQSDEEFERGVYCSAFRVSDLPVRAAAFAAACQRVFGFSGVLHVGENVEVPEPWQMVAAANGIEGYGFHDRCIHADVMTLWFKAGVRSVPVKRLSQEDEEWYLAQFFRKPQGDISNLTELVADLLRADADFSENYTSIRYAFGWVRGFAGSLSFSASGVGVLTADHVLEAFGKGYPYMVEDSCLLKNIWRTVLQQK